MSGDDTENDDADVAQQAGHERVEVVDDRVQLGVFTRATTPTVAEWLGPEIERIMLQLAPPPAPG